MDAILQFYDKNVFTPFVYPSNWDENNIVRQLVSLFVIVISHSTLMYFTISGFSFLFIFDKNLMKDSKFLKVIIFI